MRMNKKSRLHLPRVPARPGRNARLQLRATFARRRGAAARGQRARPRHEFLVVDWCACSTTAARPWVPGIRISMPSDLQVGLRHMLLTRLYDDRMQRMQRAGKISFYIRSLGEEAVAVAQGMALRPGDMLFPAYRNQGLQIVRGISLVDLMCQLLSNTRDMCKGRQLPVMYHSRAGQHFFHLRQSRDAISAGRGLGHGGGHQGRR